MDKIKFNVCSHCGREYNFILSAGYCEGCLNYINHKKENEKVEFKEIKLSIDWIKRLKDYTDKVRNTANDNEIQHKMVICALLGYLDSLEFLLNNK